jgi:hypothetical protein
MSKPRFLADENFRGDIVKGALRAEPAMVVSTVHDHGLSGASDPTLLEFAARNDLIVLTHDFKTMIADAYRRIAEGKRMTGLFAIEQAANARPIIDFLVLTWAASDSSEWHDVVEYPPS